MTTTRSYYQPLEDAIIDDSPKATPPKLSLLQIDALKRVMVYHRNYQEELSNGVDQTKEQHESIVIIVKSHLEKEIAHALTQNVELSQISQQLDSPAEGCESKLLGDFFDKPENHDDFHQAKQTYYLQQIKSLGFQIRHSHSVYTVSSVIELSQKLMDSLFKYEAAGGNVAESTLLNDYQLPLGTVFKFAEARKQRELSPLSSVSVAIPKL
ncbi:MAG: hypothetical protein P4M14_02750 [Gammaproteobacteria bacterium]|nr:hypothetical protein [Gammaproteobacteria bacterium]